MKTSNDSLLRNTLVVNGLFSTISGFVLLLFEGFMMQLFNIDFFFAETGIALLFFGLFVLYTALQNPINQKLVKVIIGMDVAWVIGSAIVIAVPLSISRTGVWAVIVVALLVADFALFQYRGLTKIIA